MAIEGLQDFSQLTVVELYAVYVDIAEADFVWRRKAMYGDTQPPQGHSVFRPLPFELFHQRLLTARGTMDGDTRLRQRLARQAAAYRVNVDHAVKRTHHAA